MKGTDVAHFQRRAQRSAGALGRPQADRRERHLRRADAARRPPGRLRPGDRDRRLQARDHARGPRAHPCPEPPDGRPDHSRAHAPRVARRAAQALRPRRAEGQGGVVAPRSVVAPRRLAQRRVAQDPGAQGRGAHRRRPGRRHPRAPRPLRGHHHRRGAALQGAGLARLRRDGGRIVVHQRLRTRRRRQPDQEHQGQARPRRHRGALQDLRAAPRPGRGLPGRRAHAAHGEVPAGSRRPPRRLLQAGAEHPHRGRAPGSAHQGARQHARRPRGLQRHDRLRGRRDQAPEGVAHAAGGARVRAVVQRPRRPRRACHARPTRPASRGRCG